MGAWGFKALDSDDALDAVEAINEVVIKKLRKELKTSTRAAAEYLIRMHKAGLLSDYDVSDTGLGEQAIEGLSKVKKVLESPDAWWPPAKPQEVEKAQRETNKDINRQIRYLKKILERSGQKTEILLDDVKSFVIVKTRKKTKNKSASKKRR